MHSTVGLGAQTMGTFEMAPMTTQRNEERRETAALLAIHSRPSGGRPVEQRPATLFPIRGSALPSVGMYRFRTTADQGTDAGPLANPATSNRGLRQRVF